MLAADTDPDANFGLALGFPTEELDTIIPSEVFDSGLHIHNGNFVPVQHHIFHHLPGRFTHRTRAALTGALNFSGSQ